MNQLKNVHSLDQLGSFIMTNQIEFRCKNSGLPVAIIQPMNEDTVEYFTDDGRRISKVTDLHTNLEVVEFENEGQPRVVQVTNPAKAH